MKDQSNNISGLKEQITALSGDIWLLAPEITLVITILLLLGFDFLFKNNKKVGIIAIAASGLAFTLAVSVQGYGLMLDPKTLFGGLLIHDPPGHVFRMLFVIAGLLMLVISSRRQSVLSSFGRSSELLVVTLALLLGASLMSMAANLLMIYIAIELVSISSYILTGILNSRAKSEASIKYVLFGGVASAVMIYGMSWLYGLTGTLDILDGSFYSGLAAAPALALSIALAMTIGGFVFKLGAFPFHIWSPDVYQAAPTPVVAIFSFVPKLAALVILFRLVPQLPMEHFDWQLWLGVVAIGSMTVGNFAALWQKDAKRMMAYSSIAHAGFLLVGLLAYTESGSIAAIFYASVYLLMNFSAFLLITYFEKQNGSANMEKLRGLGHKMPWIGVMTVIVMIALTGLPPTAGFSAKLFIFSSLWDSWQAEGPSILLWVFIFGLLNTAVALFYYLKIPFYLFFKSPIDEMEPTSERKVDLLWGTIFVLPLLLLFFRSNWLIDFLNNVSFVL